MSVHSIWVFIISIERKCTHMQNDYRWYDSRQLIYLFGVQAIGSPISNRPRASAIALKSRNSRGDLSTDRNSHSCIYQIHCRVPVYLRLSLLTRPHSHFRLISLSLMQNTIAKRYSIYIYIYSSVRGSWASRLRLLISDGSREFPTLPLAISIL